MDKIKECLDRTAEVITSLIEGSDIYRIEDVSELTKLNCEIAEISIKMEEVRNATIRTPKKSTRTNKTTQ